MTPNEAAVLDREDLQPVPDSFPDNFKLTIKDKAKYNEKPVRFSFPHDAGFIKGEGTLHVSGVTHPGRSLVMIMATNSYPDIATVFHFYLSQDKFDKIVSTDTGFELNL